MNGGEVRERQDGAQGAWGLILAAIVGVALLVDPALAQCRMCRSALESAEAAPLAWAFRRAILFLLATPFVTVAVIAISIARDASRRPPAAPQVRDDGPEGPARGSREAAGPS